MIRQALAQLHCAILTINKCIQCMKNKCTQASLVCRSHYPANIRRKKLILPVPLQLDAREPAPLRYCHPSFVLQKAPTNDSSVSSSCAGTPRGRRGGWLAGREVRGVGILWPKARRGVCRCSAVLMLPSEAWTDCGLAAPRT